MVFKIFVWFSLTNNSKNIFSVLTVITLFLTFNFPFIAGAIFGVAIDMNLLKIYCLIYSTARYCVIPFEMILCHSNLRKFFKLKLSIVWSICKVFSLNVLLCIVKLFTSMYNVFRSNQVAPINIPVWEINSSMFLYFQNYLSWKVKDTTNQTFDGKYHIFLFSKKELVIVCIPITERTDTSILPPLLWSICSTTHTGRPFSGSVSDFLFFPKK